jgi:DNA processing protein
MNINKISPPEILEQTSSCPEFLYAIGKLKLLEEKTLVAIVGSRRASDYGLRNAFRIAQKLAERGVVVVSGLALGIDAAAHKGALEVNGKTVAVLGSAIDKFEPRSNEPLARKILENDGLIISEYPQGAATYPTNFVLRNRIIAGLSQAINCG